MVPLLALTRYTEPAQHVLVLAEQQALAGGDPAISTGEMLLGLLRADRAVAAGALESLGITAGAVRRRLAAITRPDEDGASSYGIFVLPLPALATVLLVRRQPATRGLPGLISGLGVPLLYVAYVNRAGPGTICTTVTGGQECNDEWSPWPWLAVGVILVVLGVAVFVGRQRRASLRS